MCSVNSFSVNRGYMKIWITLISQMEVCDFYYSNQYNYFLQTYLCRKIFNLGDIVI